MQICWTRKDGKVIVFLLLPCVNWWECWCWASLWRAFLKEALTLGILKMARKVEGNREVNQHLVLLFVSLSVQKKIRKEHCGDVLCLFYGEFGILAFKFQTRTFNCKVGHSPVHMQTASCLQQLRKHFNKSHYFRMSVCHLHSGGLQYRSSTVDENIVKMQSQREDVLATSARHLSFLLVFPSIFLYWCFSPHRLAFSLSSLFVFLSILMACHVAFSLCPFSLSFPSSLLWLCPSFGVIKCSSSGR